MPRPYLFLYVTSLAVLALAPCGVAAGLWLALGAGWGVLAGSAAYGAVALVALLADMLPDASAEHEISR